MSSRCRVVVGQGDWLLGRGLIAARKDFDVVKKAFDDVETWGVNWLCVVAALLFGYIKGGWRNDRG